LEKVNGGQWAEQADEKEFVVPHAGLLELAGKTIEEAKCVKER
jgi:hypothetical protein